MTLQELLFEIDGRPWLVSAYFLALPLLAGLGRWFHIRGRIYDSPVRWLYTLVLYGVSIPGIIAVVALAETVKQGRSWESSGFR